MKTLTIPGPSRDSRLSTIWAIIESRQKFPAVIAVLSATESDDTDSVARGLAEVAQKSGQRTAFLRLAAAPEASNSAADYTNITLSQRGSVREEFDAGASSWRESYGVVFVDVGHFSSQPLFAHVASICDGLVLAVCDDRRIVSADRELKATLDHLSAHMLGAVKTCRRQQVAVGEQRRTSFLRAWLPARQQ